MHFLVLLENFTGNQDNFYKQPFILKKFNQQKSTLLWVKIPVKYNNPS